MAGYIIPIIITMFFSIYIQPYLDTMRQVAIDNGNAIADVNKAYNILTAVIYIGIYLVVFFIICLIKVLFFKRR